MPPQFDRRRRPHIVGDQVVSFPSLGREFAWPTTVVDSLREALSLNDPAVLPSQLLSLLRSQGVVVEEQALSVGRAFPGICVDGLSLAGLDQFPPDGPLLYIGDPQGGFYASMTGSGGIPCPQCLMRRYLSGRQASPRLYQALSEGAQVEFETWSGLEQMKFDMKGEQVVVFGHRPARLKEVLPLPDCQTCGVGGYTAAALQVGPFSPLTRAWVSETRHTIRLPQMLWLVGEGTVGGGSAWSLDPEQARVKATHEALERYSAHFRPSDQRFRNRDGEKRAFPTARAVLTEPGSVSTGLACRLSLDDAIADGLREVCERDALARFWLAADRGEPSCAQLGPLGGEIQLLALPSLEWPTVVAMGRDEQGRLFFGSACGELAEAREKAIGECRQNLELLGEKPREALPGDPDSFWEHALYYWCRPELFPALQFLSAEAPVNPLAESVWWLELTPRDLRALGYHAVRVHVPGLLYTPMSHRDWPELLAGRTSPPHRPHPFA